MPVVISGSDVRHTFLQHCEGIRRDVLPVNTAMVKGSWFTPIQSQNYGNVTFPGRVYAADGACPSPGGAYDLDCFLQANLLDLKGVKGLGRRRVMVAKGWPPGDEGRGGYQLRPWGLVREVVGKGGGKQKSRGIKVRASVADEIC